VPQLLFDLIVILGAVAIAVPYEQHFAYRTERNEPRR
jgi:hypothetical protein